jgi:hypothetical protein
VVSKIKTTCFQSLKTLNDFIPKLHNVYYSDVHYYSTVIPKQTTKDGLHNACDS